MVESIAENVRFCSEGHNVETGVARMLADWGELPEPLRSQVRELAEREDKEGPICRDCTKRKGMIVRARGG